MQIYRQANVNPAARHAKPAIKLLIHANLVIKLPSSLTCKIHLVFFYAATGLYWI